MSVLGTDGFTTGTDQSLNISTNWTTYNGTDIYAFAASGKCGGNGVGDNFGLWTGTVPANRYCRVTISDLPTSGQLWLVPSIPVGGSSASIRFIVTAGGDLQVVDTTGGYNNPTGYTIAAGDTLEGQIIGTSWYMLKNGTQIATGTLGAVQSGSTVGLLVSSTSTGFFDNWEVGSIGDCTFFGGIGAGAVGRLTA